MIDLSKYSSVIHVRSKILRMVYTLNCIQSAHGMGRWICTQLCMFIGSFEKSQCTEQDVFMLCKYRLCVQSSCTEQNMCVIRPNQYVKIRDGDSGDDSIVPLVCWLHAFLCVQFLCARVNYITEFALSEKEKIPEDEVAHKDSHSTSNTSVSFSQMVRFCNRSVADIW